MGVAQLVWNNKVERVAREAGFVNQTYTCGVSHLSDSDKGIEFEPAFFFFKALFFC